MKYTTGTFVVILQITFMREKENKELCNKIKHLTLTPQLN